MSTINVPVKTIGVGGRWMAVALVGGITLHGPSCEDEITAVQSLFWQMGPNAQITQAPIALGLALNQQTIADFDNEMSALAVLEAPKGPDDNIEPPKRRR